MIHKQKRNKYFLDNTVKINLQNCNYENYFLEQEVGLVFLELKMDYGEKFVMILDCKYRN